MDKELTIRLKNQILSFLNKQVGAVTHRMIYDELNLNSYPSPIVNNAMNDMVHRGYLAIKGISGARHLYLLTDAGKEFVKEGGFLGRLNQESIPKKGMLKAKDEKPVKKRSLFISYASDNYDKVKLIKKELADHPLFEPYIVADRRRPNNALVKLVKEGIESSYCIIPIISPQSYKEQWINQEIGYAEGVRIPIKPIVEESLLSGDHLKGFVNKQHQCPYTYKVKQGLVIRDENKGFMQCFRLLIKDLENELEEEKNSEKELIKKSNQSLLGPSTRIIGIV